MDVLVYLLGGFTAGSLGVILGLGGGVVLVPILTLWLGHSMQEAVGVSLVVIIANSLTSSLPKLKDGLIDLCFAVRLDVCAVVGGAAGAGLSLRMHGSALKEVFASLLLLSAAMIFGRPWFDKRGAWLASKGGRVKNSMTYLFIAGSAVFSGLLGIGGGSTTVPILRLWTGLGIDRAVAMSGHIMAVSAAAGACYFYLHDRVLPEVAGLSILGVQVGSLLTHRFVLPKIKERPTELLFAGMLVLLAWRMF